jgi:predicted small lipoprotein YifL
MKNILKSIAAIAMLSVSATVCDTRTHWVA